MNPDAISIKPHRTKDGTWYVRLDLGRSSVTGRRVQPYRQFPSAKTEEEAVAQARQWASTLNTEGNVSGEIVSDLAREFIARFEKIGKSPNTAKTYRTCLNWVEPYIGRLRAADVTANEIADVEWALLTKGGRDREGLTASSVQAVHWFLSSLWKWMARAGAVDYNVVSLVDKPSYITPEAFALSMADLRAVSAAISDRMASGDAQTCSDAMAAWVAMHTGMRCGEVCALRISDIKNAGYIHVCGTCIDVERGVTRRPTTKGRKNRNATISTANAGVIASYVSSWRADADGQSPLLWTADGSWPSPGRVGAAFKGLCRELGVRASFHTLRHTHATWLLAQGVPINTVSKRLGHSRPSVTMDIYDHAIAGDDDRAALVMDGLTDMCNGGATGGHGDYG